MSLFHSSGNFALLAHLLDSASKDANFVNSLNGKIAGVTINKSASGAGGSTRVVMRGAKSIEGDNNVLYVIDGIPLFNTTLGEGNGVLDGDARSSTEGIADFNPEDIESISVLSGPSAAALYGSSAANGVKSAIDGESPVHDSLTKPSGILSSAGHEKSCVN